VADNAHPDSAASREDRSRLARSRGRYRLACLGFALGFLVIAGRLTSIGLFSSIESVSGGWGDISTTVHRPDILDRHGRLLATDIKGATLYADPARVIDQDELLEQVASVLPDINAPKLAEKLRHGRRFVRIKRELTPKQQAEIHELGQPGLGFIEEYRRVYPAGATAGHVVGFVNVDNQGLAGIEKFIDDNPQLAMSGPENPLGEQAVKTSLDLGVQHVVREELVTSMRTFKAKAATGLVIDVQSGEVLSLVSLPDYDPNKREQTLDKDRINRLSSGVYEMGSVFKVFNTAIALDAGSSTLRSSYDATHPIRVGSFTISDFHGKKRRLTVPEIFIYSSNIGSAKMALDLGSERQKALLGKIGLLGDLRTELGPTAAPIVPNPWQRLNTITIAFGHGLSVAPLQFAASALPLLNGGYGVRPTFLPRPRDEGLKQSPAVLKRSTSKSMLALMRMNVLKGTGKRAEAEGYRVGGKTGTAEKVVGRHYDRSALLTSFLAVFPTDAPEYLVLVMLDEPKRVAESHNQATAGVNAAPTAGRIIERIAPILGVPPKIEPESRPFDEKVLASY
jgi:cell division protein FtsI (penicillin-binding protein 3)